MTWIGGGVTAAQGFRAAGISTGIKRSRQPDLALVVSDRPATAVAVFTENRVQAAPVLLSRARLRRRIASAVLINSGCANCLTGPQGLRDAITLSHEIAQRLAVSPQQVLVASTGIIGKRLPVPRMHGRLGLLTHRLRRTGHHEAALAILTTDTMTKEAAIRQRIAGRICSLGGMAKGAGMIAPSMATMLCALTTDVSADPATLQRLLREAVGASFNQISVDGDMSTNDTVFLLANGRSGVRLQQGTAAMRQFGRMLHEVCQRLAYLIVKDGEGTSRIARIFVEGARTAKQARACARQVATSSLVRTMLAGADPNVGRIAAAVGASGARFDPDRLEIAINHHAVVRHGVAEPLSNAMARRLLAPREVAIRIGLHAGRGTWTMLASDLTELYVRINARYAT